MQFSLRQFDVISKQMRDVSLWLYSSVMAEACIHVDLWRRGSPVPRYFRSSVFVSVLVFIMSLICRFRYVFAIYFYVFFRRPTAPLHIRDILYKQCLTLAIPYNAVCKTDILYPGCVTTVSDREMSVRKCMKEPVNRRGVVREGTCPGGGNCPGAICPGCRLSGHPVG